MNGENATGGTAMLGSNEAQTDFGFAHAFKLMLNGRNVSRRQFGSNGNLIFCRAQMPDANSMNTLPYIQMIKEVNGVPVRFPVTLSPESMFANDWYEVV